MRTKRKNCIEPKRRPRSSVRLKKRDRYQKETVAAPEKADPDKRAKLEAVKRWFLNDWQRIEPS